MWMRVSLRRRPSDLFQQLNELDLPLSGAKQADHLP